MAQRVIIIHRDLMGYLFDDDGNRYNEKHQRTDDWGHVIPDPWEEPATSSFGSGSAGTWKPQTLADYNRPDLFYHKRAEIQIDEDFLDKEPQDQDSQFQETPDSELLARVLRMREENAAYFKHLDDLFGVNARITEEMNQGEEISKPSEGYKDEVDEIKRLLCAEENENLVPNCTRVDRHSLPVDRHTTNTPPTNFCEQHIDRQEIPDIDRQKPVSTDTHLPVDRHTTNPLWIPKPTEPKLPPELPVLIPDIPNPPEPPPKPLELHETQTVKATRGDTHELNDDATPGSYEQRSPDSVFQPPRERLKVHSGAIVVLAADLIDPRDTYAVYSKGPRPPPLEQRQSLLAAYNTDPEESDAVYHLGPRPP